MNFQKLFLLLLVIGLILIARRKENGGAHPATPGARPATVEAAPAEDDGPRRTQQGDAPVGSNTAAAALGMPFSPSAPNARSEGSRPAVTAMKAAPNREGPSQ